MLLVARKNLFSEPARLAISVGGVALAVFLITVLLSLYRAWDDRVGGFVEESDIDIWIGSEGTISFLAAASLLPETDILSGFAEVEQSSPLIVRPLQGLRVQAAEKDGAAGGQPREMSIHLIGYDTQTGIGGPIEIVEGKSTPGPGEIIIDEALEQRYGVSVGQTMSAGGLDWKVVGKSRGGDLVVLQTVFVDIQQAREVLRMEGLATFYALRLNDGVEAQELARRLEMLQPTIRAFTREEFAAKTRDNILGNVLPILAVVLALAFIVGLAITGLTIYTATIEKAREYGILKAVGFRNGYLYHAVLEQSLVTAFLGFLIGVALTVAVGPFASDLVPQFVLSTRWPDVLGVAVITLLMATIAACIPVRRLASIDPVTVFKA